MKYLLAVAFSAISLSAQDIPNPASDKASEPAKTQVIDKESKPAPKTTGTRWEYKTLTASNNWNETENLDVLGSDGWELVSVVYVTLLESKVVTKEANTTGLLRNQLRYYFKRPLP